MRFSSLLYVLSATALSLAACSSDSNNLLDTGALPDDVADDAPAPDAPIDLPRDLGSDVAIDAPRDAPDASDAQVATDATDTTDTTDATDAGRDVVTDTALDTALDVPADILLDAVIDTPVDVARDAPADVHIDAPVDLPVDLPVDAPRDALADAAIDLPPDTGCGTLASCSGRCVNTQTDVTNCGACGTPCPGVDTECRRRTCVGGACGFANSAAGFMLTAQTPRDCRRSVCDAAGGVTAFADDTDLPVDGNACTDDLCVSGVPGNPPTAVGHGCGTAGMLCDGAGACVECVHGSDCATGVCVTGHCQSASCSDGVRNGTETGLDCGGSCPVCAALVVLAGGGAGVLAGSFDATSHIWNAVSLVGRTVEGVSVAVTPAGDAIGLERFTLLGDTMDNRLRYTLWRAGTWTPFADIGPTVTTQGQPAVVSAPGGVYVDFHGFDYNHYFAVWDGARWSPTAEVTGASGAHAGAIARDGANALLVFSRGLANELYSRGRVGSVWGGDQLIDGAAGFDYMVAPTAVNLTPTTTLAVWNAPGGQVRSSLRSGGAWRAATNVPMCLASGRVALARVSDTQAVMAFRGTDNNLYANTYATGAWTTPVRVATGITGTPAVARGLTGATAEMAYLDGAGRVMHSRLAAGVWGAAATVGGTGLSSVALASGP